MVAVIALSLLLGLKQMPPIETFTVDGVERQAMVSAPKDAGLHPLVFVYHGHGGGMRQAARNFDVHTLWPEAVVVYPTGLPTSGKTDPKGEKNGWQQNPGEQGDRDLKFFDSMLGWVKKKYKVDDKRIYAMGHSNGGRFTYVLWAKRGDVFAAYGPSGSPSIGLAASFKPASVFAVAGESDPIVPYAGQKFGIERLKTLLGVDISKAKTTGYATYAPAKGGLEMGTYIHPGGHEYPKDAAKLIVEFFKRNPKR